LKRCAKVERVTVMICSVSWWVKLWVGIPHLQLYYIIFTRKFARAIQMI